jgi:hypothetical protein
MACNEFPVVLPGGSYAAGGPYPPGIFCSVSTRDPAVMTSVTFSSAMEIKKMKIQPHYQKREGFHRSLRSPLCF